LEAGCGDGGRCNKFQIFQISNNFSLETLKVLKIIQLVLLMWMDAKEDYEGKTSHWVIACGMEYVTKRKYPMSVSFANSVIWTS